MSDGEIGWRVSESAGAATSIRGAPVHAFWPVLASSFRWVLLPPHRRAGGDEIMWKWRSEPAPRTPQAPDLDDLRLRLRDGLDLLEEELQRHPALPERLSPEDLIGGMKQALHELRFGSDATLADFAVYTTLGWMLRSWGFPRPSPAQADTGATPYPAESPPTPRLPPTRATNQPGKRLRRRILAAGLGATLAVALAYCGHRARTLRADNEASATPEDSTRIQEAPAAPRETPPARPSPAVVTRAVSSPKGSGAGAGAGASGQAQPASATRSPTQVGAASRNEQETAAPVLLAITGEMPAMPELRLGRAGLPSTLPGDTDPGAPSPPPPPDASADTPPASGSGTHSGPPGPEGKGEAPPPADEPASSPSAATRTRLRLVQSEGVAGEPTTPPETTPFNVKMREASRSGSLAPPLQNLGSTASVPAPASEPEPDLGSDARRSERAPPPPRPASATGDATPPVSRIDLERIAATVGPASPPVATPTWPPGNTGELRVVFQGRPMPWRLVLERDAPLPTRPGEGNGEEEMRAARIAAWAQARALLPPILRRHEGRAGWSLRLASTNRARGAASWKDARDGAPLPATVATITDEEARIGWVEGVATDLDAILADDEGRALARVRRFAADNRAELQTSAGVERARLWFSLSLREGEEGGGIGAPAGWELRRLGEELVAEGPAEAARFRWEHPASGWVLHGGYARDSR